MLEYHHPPITLGDIKRLSSVAAALDVNLRDLTQFRGTGSSDMKSSHADTVFSSKVKFGQMFSDLLLRVAFASERGTIWEDDLSKFDAELLYMHEDDLTRKDTNEMILQINKEGERWKVLKIQDGERITEQKRTEKSKSFEVLNWILKEITNSLTDIFKACSSEVKGRQINKDMEDGEPCITKEDINRLSQAIKTLTPARWGASEHNARSELTFGSISEKTDLTQEGMALLELLQKGLNLSRSGDFIQASDIPKIKPDILSFHNDHYRVTSDLGSGLSEVEVEEAQLRTMQRLCAALESLTCEMEYECRILANDEQLSENIFGHGNVQKEPIEFVVSSTCVQRETY